MGEMIGGRYELGDFIAQGGMGAVYRGTDYTTGRPVAIKQVKADLISADPSLPARFKREGETLAALNHPNIVRYVDSVEADGQYYLIMDYVGGGSLADVLASEGRLPPDRALHILLELADALARSHHLQIIHCDLKPGNVLLAEDGTPRLADFGVAISFDGQALTSGQVIVGTLAYLAPEVLSGQPHDTRADIWAFGVLMYELLIGRRPFEAENTDALVTAILYSPLPDLETIHPDLTPATIDLLYRLLAKDPQGRIDSMRGVAFELEMLVRHKTEDSLDFPLLIILSNQPNTPTGYVLPPITPAEKHGNLPVQTTPFVGREAELAELARLIADPAIRLITILAPGGMGKTRLSLEAAAAQDARYPHGVYFVSLAPIVDPALIVSAAADALGFQFYQGRTPQQQLLDYLREKSMLIVFDNFEQILAGATLLTDILQTAPGVRLLATSRERLNLQEETLFRIEGMDFPDWETLEGALEYSAVKLFLQSARRVQPRFTLNAEMLIYLARICRQVQGMPLGILLAAAWVDSLSLEEISDEIAKSLDFLETDSRNVPVRQRSIRAVFDYSWHMLSSDEQNVLVRLSVFRGGFTREAAQTVTGASLRTLIALVNKSMLRRDPVGRYDIHELLRQYAAERLAESSEARRTALEKHCSYYANFVERTGKRRHSALFLQATAEFELELRNILLAWDTATERADAQLMWQLIDETLEFMQFSFAINDFEVMTKTAETHSQGWEPGLALGISLLVQGIYADMRGDNNQVRTLLQQSLTILRTQDAPRETAIALIYLADELPDKDLIDESISLATSVGDEYLINLALRTRAGIQFYYGDFSQAQVSAHQALSLALDQNDPDALGWIYQRIGQIAYFQGLYDQAQEAGQKALSIRHELGNRRLVGLSRGILAMVASALRNYAEAEKEFKEAYALAEEVGDRVQMNFVMMNFGLMNYERGDYPAAKQLLLEVLNYRRDSGRSSLANDLNNLGHPTAALGEYAEAEGYFSQALRLAHIKSMALESVMGIANLIAKRGQKERAVALLSLVLADPRSGSEVMRLADRFLAELQAELSPEVFATAQERGKTFDLDTVIADLLANPIFPENARLGGVLD